MGIEDVKASDLVKELAEELKKVKEIKVPAWSNFVKTGRHKERPPEQKDWWYLRTASVLRNVYKKGPIGTSKLRTKYGGKKSRGVAPKRFYKGSGKMLRNMMQQLEKAGFVKEVKKGVHKGRVLTAKGKALLKSTAEKVKAE